MLKIKRIQILGFKSFCDRTEMLFQGTGVVGIVGPNGCGKSNLADAICWVLGEQSVKSLRGQRMEDVIFAGTRERKPTGMAEVSLTLVNPQEYEVDAEADEPPLVEIRDDWDGEVASAGAEAEAEVEVEEAEEVAEETVAVSGAESGPTPVLLKIRRRRKFVKNNRRGEIVVTRRLYRSGESEYLMNGKLCRLRDIQDLFMGTGLGPESYAIIEQGRIGQILSSKPHDRRAIIEEAAGVTKYKARRKLAEARLDSARQNLNRINDIFEEVTRQMGSLKRQAAKAQRYSALKSELDQHQRRLLLSRGLLLESEQQGAQAAEAAVATELSACQQQLEGEEAARAEWARTSTALEQELRQLTELAGQLAMELDRTERQIAFNQQQAEEFRRRGASHAEESTRLSEQRGVLDAEAAAAQTEIAAVEAELIQARETRQRQQAASEAAHREVQQLEQRIENARRRVLQGMNQIAALSHQTAQGETLLQGLDRQLARLREEQETAQTELGAQQARRQELAGEVQARQAEKEAVEADLAALEQQLRQERAQQEEGGRGREQLRQQLADVAARRRSLEEIVAEHGYSTDAVKKLFAKGEPLTGPDGQQFQPIGLLAEFIEVDPPYEQVVEEFLREELNYVVVKSWDEAGTGLGLLRSESGRATFLIHPDDGQLEMFAGQIQPPALQDAAPPAGPSAPIPLRHCVRVLNGFGRSLELILPKLGCGYILPEPSQARRLAEANPAAYFLTPLGECFHHLTVTGGSRSGSGPLTIKRELRELARQEHEQQAAITAAEERLQACAAAIAAAQQRLETQRQNRHELEKQILTSRQAGAQVEAEMARLEGRLRLHRAEDERYRQERRQAEEKLRQIREQLARIETERAAAEREEQELGASVAAARERRDLAAHAAAEAQSALARLEERAHGARERGQRLERACRELAARLELIEGERSRFAQQEAALTASNGEMHARLEQLRLRRRETDERKTRVDTALLEAREKEAALDAALRRQRETLDSIRERHGALQVSLARIDSEIGHLLETCRNELGCELSALRDDTALQAAEGDELAGLDQAARELRTRIDNLGPVNMMALEEYKETEERHQFLETQRKDLLDSIADTQKAIEEIDTLSRQRFAEAFERINGFFQETFTLLFGGGQGFLKLNDPENDPDSGVDIVAQPPGKKLQNALLLSGGEKAMTAMALLMSVFQYQPSPFCVLDEVDAPLDEANVSRFANMVRRMSEQTQFILITHNKRTMEIAPTLYGVTMHQPGVSRLVSVHINGQAQAAAV